MNCRAIIILCIMSCVLLCNATEIPTRNSRIRAIDFLTNDKIIIGGDYCCEGYSIKKKVSSLIGKNDTAQDPIYDIALSSDKKKIALLKAKNVVIYDLLDNGKAITFSLDLKSGSDCKISFNSNKFSLCDLKNYPHMLLYYDCTTKQFFEEVPDLSTIHSAIHITGDHHPIIMTDLDTMYKREKERMGNFRFYLLSFRDYREKFPSGECNYDGSWLAINMSGESYRFISTRYSSTDQFEISSIEKNSNEDKFYIAIAFHKNNITAALLKNNGCIEFWDYKNKTLLEKMYCRHGKKKMLWKERDCRDQLLSFSPDCKQFIASIGRKAYLYQTPFQATCILGTKKHAISLFFALKNYFSEIPQDVICNIIGNFLWCSEFDNEKRANKIMSKIIRVQESKMSSAVEEKQQEIIDEKDDDCYSCNCTVKKSYLHSLVALACAVGAFYAFVS